MIEFIIPYENITKHLSVVNNDFFVIDWWILPINKEIIPYLKYFKDYRDTKINISLKNKCRIIEAIKNDIIIDF